MSRLIEILEIVKGTMQRLFRTRIFILFLVFCLIFASLIYRIFDLQIVNGQEYLDNYKQKSYKEVTTERVRGNIRDRNGVILAYDKLVYNVTLTDLGVYSGSSLNLMILNLVHLLEQYGEKLINNISIQMTSAGEFEFTTATEKARLALLRDIYGQTSISGLSDEQKNSTARDVYEYLVKRYKIDAMQDEDGNSVDIDEEEALQIANIRYELSLNEFRKYLSIDIASDVSEAAKIAILESSDGLVGVDIEEQTKRVYPNSEYYAHILGYTGEASAEQLKELQEQDDTYESGDIIGRTGIESVMELQLSGTKGKKSMYVDNKGTITEVLSDESSTIGNDVYLTIDSNLQIGAYHLLEKSLAGIIVSKLTMGDFTPTENTTASGFKIPIKDVYFQMINNNIISLDNLQSDSASDVERVIYSKFSSEYNAAVERIRAMLTTDPVEQGQLSEQAANYTSYIHDFFLSSMFSASRSNEGWMLSDNIDTNSENYKRWEAGTISLRELLYYALTENWIDINKLDSQEKYSNTDDLYNLLVDYIMGTVLTEKGFFKIVYKNLIKDSTITGNEICMALIEQGIVDRNDDEVRNLSGGSAASAFNFMLNKIKNIEITPAQIALDPCSGSIVMTDPNSGEVLALVNYPNYDNNRFSGRVETEYYNKLYNDLSSPLYSRATQVRTAPGSTYKIVTSVAALEEGVISATDQVACTGTFNTGFFANLPYSNRPTCWIYSEDGVTHGAVNTASALANSCNIYFYEMGYRLSLDGNGQYNEKKGLETIAKYAAMFGLDSTSGIELNETSPIISDENPVPTAIGQGTNNFTTIQLARYVTTVANRGTLYKMSVLDKVVSPEGEVIEDFTPEVTATLDEVQDSTWDAVQLGMRMVVTDGTTAQIFKGSTAEIAGKTGSAQENKLRGNHAHFISFAPYSNPEITVTVSIPNGYTSGNTAKLASQVYDFYDGVTTLDEILSSTSISTSDATVGD